MIDLHLHSTYSDGTMTPAELVDCAAKSGLVAISVTDHDTVAGTGETIAAGNETGIEVVAGLEISSEYRGLNVHLLGYDFDWRNRHLSAVLERLQKSRADRNKKIIEKLSRLGITIGEDELQRAAGTGVTGRPHFAKLLVRQGVVKTIDQAFDNYLKTGRCAYVPRYLLRVDEAIQVIHQAGGVAVLAHPVQLSCPVDQLKTILKELKQIGLDGVETYYPTQNGRVGKQLKKIAQQLQLLQTGGSDYHGNVRPNTSMADGTRRFTVPEKLLIELLQWPRKNKPSKTT